jgi:hypothetical protein
LGNTHLKGIQVVTNKREKNNQNAQKKVWRKIDDNFAPALSLKYERDQEITNKKNP